MPSPWERRGPQTSLIRVALVGGAVWAGDSAGGKARGGAIGRSFEASGPGAASPRARNSQNASVPAANQKKGPPGVFDVAAPDSAETSSAIRAATSAPR